MNKNILLLLCMSFAQVFLFYFVESNVLATIIEAQIIPPNPTDHDSISIYSYGGLAHIDSSFDHSELALNDNLLQLDIFYHRGYLDVPGTWNHTEVVGQIPAGTYDLNVNIFEGQLKNSYLTEFEVVPEPMSLSLLSIGVLALRFRKKRKR